MPIWCPETIFVVVWEPFPGNQNPRGPGPSTSTSTSASASASARPRASRASSRFSRAFVARCHVRDVVAILCASMRQADDERWKTPEAFDSGPNAVPDIRTYNAADDAPAPRAVALAFAAALLAEKRDVRNETGRSIAFATEENEPSLFTKNKKKLQNDRGEKRVRNDRAKTELGVAFAFPTYKEGLAAVADATDPSPFSDATLDVL